MRSLYEKLAFDKVAASAWQRMLAAGQIGAEELRRMLPGQAVQGEGAALRALAPRVRAALQTPGEELAGEALQRHIRGAAARETLKTRLAGGSTVDLSRKGPHIEQRANLLSFLPGQPETVAVPVVDPLSGTVIRHVSEGTRLGKYKAMALQNASGITPEFREAVTRPVDKSLFAMTAAHERAEALGSNLMVLGRIPPNTIGTHLHPEVTKAERLATRHGEALQRMDAFRAGDGVDGALLRKLDRQAGQVANYTPPLGGRASRSVAHQVARAPATEAAHLRMLTGGPVSTQGEARVRQLAAPPGLVERWTPRALRSPHLEIQRSLAQSGLAAAAATSRAPTFDRTDPAQVRAYLAHLTSV